MHFEEIYVLCIYIYVCVVDCCGHKENWNASRICVLSLHRGLANLLCIVPILVYTVACDGVITVSLIITPGKQLKYLLLQLLIMVNKMGTIFGY